MIVFARQFFTAILISTFCIGLNACAESGRWYTADQVELGEEIYRSNCLVCHKESGMATEDWKKKDVDGKFPPPPLNGTAHTWHHDLGILRKTVLEGGVKLGGSMPGFKGVLSDQDIAAVIAYVQSLWPDEIFNRWAKAYPEDARDGLPSVPE